MSREINLVPDIKGEMIKALKLRNFIFFLCIVVTAASVGLTVVVALIMGGQQLALDSKKATLETLSSKLNSYSDLNDFLTIKDQLGNLSTLSSNKKVLSRTFGILSAMLPKGADKITISELAVNLTKEQPTFTFDAQADAGKEPFIDYNVLDSFKKSMQYMRYDYGQYVDKEGNTIPSYCMIETGDDGALLRNENKDIYAYWTINADGCNPSTKKTAEDYSLEEYGGEQVVRVWRTPQFNDWYKTKVEENQPYMSLDGEISNVEHFKSACITYKGEATANGENPKWTETNETCLLVPGGSEGIKITDSSNGRDASDELVLRFSAVITLAPEAYKFSNTHMIAISPSSRYNVTDSYVQVQAMFGERAADCVEGDTACQSTPTSDSITEEKDQNSNSNGGN